MRHRAALATIYEHEIASCRAAFYPMRRDANHRSNQVLLTSGTYQLFVFRVASHARYKESRSVKWTVRKSSLKLYARFLVVADNLEVLYTSAFLTKGYGTPLVDAICEILRAPKRFFSGVSFYAVSIRSNFVKDIYTCMQFLIHLRASLLLNEYHVKKTGRSRRLMLRNTNGFPKL